MKNISPKTSHAILCIAVLLMFTVFAEAQTATDAIATSAANEIVNKPKAKLGTYQIFGLDAKFKQAFTDETFILIEESRKDHEDVTITLNFGVAVFIPSKDAIGSPNFKPLKQFYEE